MSEEHGALRIAAWLLGILVGTLVLLFALIGVLHVFRGTPVSAVAQVGSGGQPLSVGDSSFRGTVEALIQTPIDDGNRVDLLLNGNETYPALWHDMHGARSSLTVRLYYASPGELADTFKAVMTERARAGVRVFYLYDAFGTSLSEEYLDSLRAGGVDVRAFRPIHWSTLHRAQHRSHVRAVVVDGAVGYTGGFGIDDKWHRARAATSGSGATRTCASPGPPSRSSRPPSPPAWAEADGDLLATAPPSSPPSAPTPTGRPRAGRALQHPADVGSTAAERFLAALHRRRAAAPSSSPTPTSSPTRDFRRLLARRRPPRRGRARAHRRAPHRRAHHPLRRPRALRGAPAGRRAHLRVPPRDDPRQGACRRRRLGSAWAP